MIRNKKINNRIRKKSHIRKSLHGHTERPRLTVFKSNTHIYAQIIDDNNHKTIVSASDVKSDKKMKKMESAAAVGKEIAEKAIKAKVKTIVFDRNGFKYHGRIKALADAAREEGLVF